MTESRRALSRATGGGQPAAPVRHVHLGLGNFFRAHQAWYTDRSPDASEWGIAAFTGRSAALAEILSDQDGLYQLATRAADGDRLEVVSSLVSAHPAADQDSWRRWLADPDVRVVTLTVTEAGYRRAADGGLDVESVAVQQDLAALRADPTAAVETAPARLVAGLLARRRADAGPLTVVPCDNLPANGAMVQRVVRDFATQLDRSLLSWIAEAVAVVTTVVDRITPRVTDADIASIAVASGLTDRAPVVTEPFSEWILAGQFAAGRPRWEHAGARFVEEIDEFEHRKLWLLNGGHSLLAYSGPLLGHRTVAEATGDERCRAWLADWWAEAVRHLDLAADELEAYRSALLQRFSNPGIQHQLGQIAADGSEKLPVRVLPVVRMERAAGRLPIGGARVLASWLCHLRGDATAVTDPRAGELTDLAVGPLRTAAAAVLTAVAPDVGADQELVGAVADLAAELLADRAT